MTQTCVRCTRPTTGAQLCGQCQKTLAIAMANVAAYDDDMTTVATRSTRYGDGVAVRGSIGKERPLPVDMRFINVPRPDADTPGSGKAANAPAAGAQHQVRAIAVTWTRVLLKESPPLHGPVCMACIHTSCATVRRRRAPRNTTTINGPSVTVRSMIFYFDRQIRAIVRAKWVGEFLDDMLTAESALRRFVDRPPERWYAGKCSATDDSGNQCQAELYATAESGTVKCFGCGTQHDIGSRRDFLLEEAKDYLVTASEAARALIAWTDYDGTEKKLIDRIAYWRDTDRLEIADVTGLNGRDRHLYRLGDVQDRLIEHAQRTQQRSLSTAS